VLIEREQSYAGKSESFGVLAYIILVALVLNVTLDLDQPGQGMLRASQKPLERVLQSMTGP
jgi:type IV secretory pathway VirB2 component (pilin)